MISFETNHMHSPLVNGRTRNLQPSRARLNGSTVSDCGVLAKAEHW